MRCAVIEVSDDRSEHQVKPLLFSVKPYLISQAESKLRAGASYGARYAASEASELKASCEMPIEGKVFDLICG